MLNIDPKFPIIICEGVDASGKSTLINKLMERHPNNCYIHCAVTNDINSLHQNAIDTALVASQERWVFIDRLHLSEKIYGTIFRGGPSYDVDAFDAMLTSKIPTLKKILCVIDKETSLAKHAERKDKEMFNDISKVWDMYNDVHDGWVRYNWKTDEIDLDTLEVKSYPKKNSIAFSTFDIMDKINDIIDYCTCNKLSFCSLLEKINKMLKNDLIDSGKALDALANYTDGNKKVQVDIIPNLDWLKNNKKKIIVVDIPNFELLSNKENAQ